MEEHLKAFGGENLIAYSFDSASMRVMTQKAELKKCLLFCIFLKGSFMDYHMLEMANLLGKKTH